MLNPKELIYEILVFLLNWLYVSSDQNFLSYRSETMIASPLHSIFLIWQLST